MNTFLGEVREFATGMLVSGAVNGAPGCHQALMQTEQRIWDGSRWLALNDPGASDILRKMVRLSGAPSVSAQ